MKLSNKILLVTGILVLVAITYTVIGFKKVVSQGKSNKINNKGKIDSLLNAKIETKNYSLKDFKKIKFNIDGRVLIKQKDSWKVEISAPEKIFATEYTQVRKEKNILSIKTPLIGEGNRNSKIYISITLPKLEEIKVQSRTKLQLKNFEQKNMEVNVLGECLLEGSNNKIENLLLQSHGENRISFSRSEIKNANVKGFGKNQISINMAGGILQGSLGGAGVLIYSGEVKKVNVDTFGGTKVISE